MEIRKIELRNVGSRDEPLLTGYAARYNSQSEDLPHGKEIILPGAFAESIKRNIDIMALVDHDDSKVIARRSNGTLRIVEDEKGLLVEIKPNIGTTYGKDIVALVERRDITGMSIGMIVKDDEWTKETRTIKTAELLEVSIVANPAYSQTNITRRNLTMKKEQVEKKIIEEKVAEKVEDRKIPEAAVVINAGTKEDRKKEFNTYLRTGETRTMTVANQGTVLAPEDFATSIIEGLKDVSVMRQIANVLPSISGKSISYPRRTGGTGTTFVAEGAPITPHDLTFDQIVLTPKKIGSLVPITNELLSDEGVNLESYLSGHFQDEIAEVAEEKYWKGTGTGANPTGILHGTTLTRVSTAVLATLDADDIL
ncbi:phage major capsid protein, partial [bacterium AH-315-E09]|nr:phage major capsid protein [bacterium AH-315-E09]